MNNSLKAVIFDFGGVLLRTHDRALRTRWDDRLGFPPGHFEDFIFNSPAGQAAQLGRATWDDVWAVAGREFGLPLAELARARADFFAGDRLDADLAAYIRRLKQHYTIGLLSNTWHRDGRTLLQEHNLLDAFDAWVTSAEIGVMKPDPQIYRVALERVQAKAVEAVFVDDFVQNVVAARELGLQAVHYTDPVAARRALEHLTGVV